jgi:two-component system LytT family response regulator
MTPFKAIIVDDEPLARKRVRTLLRRHADFDIAAECANGRDAVAAIARHKPDLVFLDIQMPSMDGFEVIDQVGVERMPAVIFITAYDEHAMRAFDVNALDYLLKPFDERRFSKSLQRARENIELRTSGDPQFRQRLLQALAGLTSERGYRARIPVKSTGRVYFVPAEEIDWIGAAGKYVCLHVGSDEHLLRMPIGQIESELDPQHFGRIHRSTIVNLNRIKEIHPLFRGEAAVILKDGTELTLSRGYRARVRQLVDLSN